MTGAASLNTEPILFSESKLLRGITLDESLNIAFPLVIKNYFDSFFSKSSIGIAARVIIFTVPREPSSIETLDMVSLFAASTIFTKS